MKTSDKIFLGIGSVAIIGAGVVGGMAILNRDSNSDLSSQAQTSSTEISSGNGNYSKNSTSSTSTKTESSSTSSTSGYKDGTYTASASYQVPGEQNTINVTLTLKDGVISSVSAENNYSGHESGRYIDSFMSELNGEIVGHKIDGISASRIGGASLTTSGFEQALETIKQDATA